MLPKQKSSGIESQGWYKKQLDTFRTEKEKQGFTKKLASGLVQQLALAMSAAAEDFRPLVEGGGGGGEHDEVFLLQTQSAHSRCGVEAARPREDLPRDGEGGALVLQLPNM